MRSARCAIQKSGDNSGEDVHGVVGAQDQDGGTSKQASGSQR